MAQVTVTEGTLKGGRCTTERDFEYFEFLGIPYAKPPIGKLRFKSPKAPEPWEGVRNATTTDASTISLQVDRSSGSTIGSEDCLYLNVYTPELPDPESKIIPKPVMVLSHGGGFISGNGTLKAENGPDYLIEHDIVVVTINYRLGALGFFCLQIPEVAGNMGLKDHIKALQWVQSNIDKFGGNKDNVTICGVSAGSASCEFLLLSPLAKGLFHKCILESGSALNYWAINNPKKVKEMAVKLAHELGYKGSDDDMYDILIFLSGVSASDITIKAAGITEMETSVRIFFGFVPVVEKNFENGDGFLTDIPYRMLKEGKFNEVPVLRGFCNKEGTLVCAKKPITVKELVKSKLFTDYWPHALEEDDVTKYNTLLTTAYIDKAETDDDPKEIVIDYFGDLNIVAGVYLASKLECKKMPVYLYKFSYDGKLNLFKALFGLKNKGAAHSDESGYLLRHDDLSSVKLRSKDKLMRYNMTKMWTNFAKTSNPTPDDNQDLPVPWPLFTEETQEYLVIDKEFTIETKYEPEKMAIYDEIMCKYITRLMSCPCYTDTNVNSKTQEPRKEEKKAT